MTKIPIPTLIYHITSITNLVSVLKSGGLYCYRTLQGNRIDYRNIAYSNIQSRRAAKSIDCGSMGTLHDYVPFYFAPRSPMLYAINQGNVPGYTEGQEPVIYIVSTLDAVESTGLSFVFTDGHPIVVPSKSFDQFVKLDQVDWEIMKHQYWHDDDPKYPDRKRKRQAEFLIHQFFSWDLVTEIGVMNFNRKLQVEKLLDGYANKPLVKTRVEWYY